MDENSNLRTKRGNGSRHVEEEHTVLEQEREFFPQESIEIHYFFIFSLLLPSPPATPRGGSGI